MSQLSPVHLPPEVVQFIIDLEDAKRNGSVTLHYHDGAAKSWELKKVGRDGECLTDSKRQA